jgi:Na+/H+-dicarboxylate symporter
MTADGAVCLARGEAEFQFQLHKLPEVGGGLGETVRNIFKSVFTDNIVGAASQPDIMSIICFAIMFGIAASKLKLKKGERNHLFDFFGQLNGVLTMLVKAVINFAPYAIASLIMSALAKASDLSALLKDVGVLCLCIFCGCAVHAIIALPTLFFIVVKQNPFSYMRKCLPAYIFAISTSSSAATLPVSMKMVGATGEVQTSVARFVLSLGATVNMDGSAISYPAILIFLAYASGLKEEVDVGKMVSIILISTLGAIGSSPIPQAGLIMIVTMWTATFPEHKLPDQYSYVASVNFLIDMVCTCVNVIGDTLVSRMVEKMLGSEERDFDKDATSRGKTEEAVRRISLSHASPAANKALRMSLNQISEY